MCSNQVPYSGNIYAIQCPPFIEGTVSSYRVKRIIAAEPNGDIYSKYTKSGKAMPADLLTHVSGYLNIQHVILGLFHLYPAQNVNSQSTRRLLVDIEDVKCSKSEIAVRNNHWGWHISFLNQEHLQNSWRQMLFDRRLQTSSAEQSELFSWMILINHI